MAENMANNERPLVSIITPCYNGERFVARLLDSILKQTYTNIEFIFVNDGSTDSTEEIFLSYTSRFGQRGIRHRYFKQENKGQAAAVNLGLAVFTGDYLAWPDADDWLAPDSVEKRVRFLEENPDYDLVIGDTVLAYERDGGCAYGELDPRRIRKPDIFMDLLMDRGLPFNDYMIRASAFLLSVPSRQIFESTVGQNWQILLPVAHNRRCGYIDEPLFYRLVRDDSHGRMNRSLHDIKVMFEQQEIMLQKVISQMDMPDSEREFCSLAISHRYLKQNSNLTDAIMLGDLCGSIGDVRASVSKLQEQAGMLQGQINGIISSKSYRIGRVLTYIPRKLRGGIKCLRDNGLRYTVKRMGEKLCGK